MSVVVLGLSHRTAPISVLESVALDSSSSAALAKAVRTGENVTEALVLATCNRVEVYAEASTFHGAVAEVSDALAEATGVPLGTLREHLYVHYEDRAIAHLFAVACGLDSMAVGESQILGQLRDSLRVAQTQGQVGGTLNALFQQALRVGKRAHAETGIDKVSVSLVQAALAQSARVLGPLAGCRVLVIGAGAMSSLAATTVARAGARELTIINRTLARAERLAAATGAQPRPLADLAPALADADIVISCTGAVGLVLQAELVASVVESRDCRPQVYLDLALPHDVAPEVAQLPGIRLVGLSELGERLAAAGESAAHVQQVSDLVVGEVATYLAGRRALTVAPTVAALRLRAAEVVAAELGRLEQRLPELSPEMRAEVQLTVHRVVEKLLHTPTVRVKELVGDSHSGDYAEALRELFDLDPHDVAAVSVPPESGPVL